MTAIICTLILSAYLFKRGFIREVLEACKLKEQPRRRRTRKARRRPKPAPTEPTPAPPIEAPHIIETPTIEDRKKLETIGANILTAKGYKGDIWGQVRTMTNKELTDIINGGY